MLGGQHINTYLKSLPCERFLSPTGTGVPKGGAGCGRKTPQLGAPHSEEEDFG